MRHSRPRLGQHFLHDPSALERIALAGRFAPGEPVIEIGPGRGALTAALLARGARLTVIELDARLAAELRRRFAAEADFRVVERDVLQVDLADLTGDERSTLVGNLPYYITSPIVRRALDLGERITCAVFLVQKEVAERITAERGSRDYGYLSALCRLRSVPEYLFTVKPGAFRPPPKVDSAVVRLTPRPGPPPNPGLIAFLEAAFRHPRKNLLNNLSALYPREAIADRKELRLRAQQLDVAELEALWRSLEGLSA